MDVSAPMRARTPQKPPSGRPCGGSIRPLREQGRLYKAFPFCAYSPGFRPGFLLGSPLQGFRLRSSVKSAAKNFSSLARARSRNRVPTGRIRFLSVYIGLKPYAEQSRPFGAWRFRAFGGEGIPAFVPAAYDFLRANFRRATSARSRGGDVDVSAPMRARTSQSPRKGRSFWKPQVGTWGHSGKKNDKPRRGVPVPGAFVRRGNRVAFTRLFRFVRIPRASARGFFLGRLDGAFVCAHPRHLRQKTFRPPPARVPAIAHLQRAWRFLSFT